MLIWGWRRAVQQLALLTLVCQNCRNPCAHALRRVVTKFTLFFVPLFPLNSKYFVQCTFCGAQAQISAEVADQMRAQAQPSPQHVGVPFPSAPGYPVAAQGYPQQPGYPPAAAQAAPQQYHSPQPFPPHR